MPPFLASLMGRSALKYLAVVLIVLGLLSGAYYQGYKNRGLVESENQLKIAEEWNRKLLSEIQKNLRLSSQLTEAKKNVRVIREEVIKNVTKEIENPVYSECIVPPSGVSALNAAADEFNREREKNHSSEPTGEM